MTIFTPTRYICYETEGLIIILEMTDFSEWK